jgi:Leucine-rich repeat (LRR) protein
LQARSINLTAIPPWLIQCTNLKALNLGGNSISKLVECEIPPKLSYLNLPFNKMTEADLSFLLRLNHVNIAANELTKINIANLNNLEHLDISANKFSTFELRGH